MRPKHLKPKHFAVAGALALAAAAGTLALVSSRSGRAPVRAPAAAAPPPGAALVPRIHYRLAFAQDVSIPMSAPMTVQIEGEWITTPRRDGRLEVRFAPGRLDGPDGVLPAAGAFAAPVQLVEQEDVLAAMGFHAATPRPARAVMTMLATTFQVTDGAGARWTVAEEDVLGRYEAVYERDGAQLLRSRDAYVAMRGPGGLAEQGAGKLAASDDSRFVVDAHGIVTARVGIEHGIEIAPTMPSARLKVRASLERTRIEWVPAPIGGPLPAEPISDHADHAAAARSADENVVGKATLGDLLDELVLVAGLDAARPGTGQQRATALERLCAYLRLHPDAAPQVAELLRARAGEHEATQLLAGALASAGIAEAVDELAVLANAGLAPSAQTDVIDALSLAAPVTAASLDAFEAALDGADGEQALFGLGHHARMAAPELADGARGAVQTLLARYPLARSDAERRAIVGALGNTGSRDALPLLASLAAGPDRMLADAALFSLRFIPGDDVDTLLAAALPDPELALAAVRAIAYRAPAAWRDQLIALQSTYAERNDIIVSIAQTLRRWG